MTLESKLSPMMAQWEECKKNAKGALLLFRLGDFYEAFGEDASILSKQLDLVLTKRQEVPMAGIPAHTCEVYLDRLVAKGFSVALAEQLEDPSQVKGLVRREIVRIVTPGTVITSTLLQDKSANFLVALTQLNAFFGIAFLDLTTADFRVLECAHEKEVIDELTRLNPTELLISAKCAKTLGFSLQESLTCTTHIKEEWFFDAQNSTEMLLKHFRLHTLDTFGLQGMTAAIKAAGALLSYVKTDLNLSLSHVKTLRKENLAHYMALDRATQRHLELVHPLHEKSITLLEHLDRTATPMGGRLLKEWLLHPLLSCAQIHERQDQIASFLTHPEIAVQLSQQLKEIRDLERLTMRIETHHASPRDLSALRLSLDPLPEISRLLKIMGKEELPSLAAVHAKLSSALADSPPLKLSEGGIFKAGYHPELDELRALKTDSHAWIGNYQTALRAQTQIKTLKVGYTQAFGYYIEVSRGQSSNMPPTFQRRQTLVNAERFVSPELKEFEHKILNAEGRLYALEYELFQALKVEIASYADALREVAKLIATLDCLLSLADVARTYRYIRPVVDERDRIDISHGRHPVVEAALGTTNFIPNDLLLGGEKNRLLLITGPNMAGKSTYIRQAALLIILAQIGSFIPAEKASIGIVDKVFSRIGASDDLTRGQSTFMVEMAETAHILHNATSSSLIILDEIGRGTSTYDGIAIAWSVADFLLTEKGKRAKTLFATHYSELTQLAEEHPGTANYHSAVHEGKEGITFLHKIVPGATDKSYGIHVAKLAGLPSSVIHKAHDILRKLHGEPEKKAPPSLTTKDTQLELF